MRYERDGEGYTSLKTNIAVLVGDLYHLNYRVATVQYFTEIFDRLLSQNSKSRNITRPSLFLAKTQTSFVWASPPSSIANNNI